MFRWIIPISWFAKKFFVAIVVHTWDIDSLMVPRIKEVFVTASIREVWILKEVDF
jgi:hypothetical protein